MAQETALEKRETQAIQPEQIHGGPTYVPSVDIIEEESRLVLLADMPGVTAEGVDIHYERGQLTIHGRVAPRQNPDTDYLLQEYGVGDFHRRFEIGEGIDANGIEAELRDGVLRLHLPKTQEVLPRRIAVKTG